MPASFLEQRPLDEHVSWAFKFSRAKRERSTSYLLSFTIILVGLDGRGPQMVHSWGWAQQNVGVESLRAVTVVPGTLGRTWWAVGDSNTLATSTDLGLTWTRGKR